MAAKLIRLNVSEDHTWYPAAIQHGITTQKTLTRNQMEINTRGLSRVQINEHQNEVLRRTEMTSIK
jgi:hypothetical protein